MDSGYRIFLYINIVQWSGNKIKTIGFRILFEEIVNNTYKFVKKVKNKKTGFFLSLDFKQILALPF